MIHLLKGNSTSSSKFYKLCYIKTLIQEIFILTATLAYNYKPNLLLPKIIYLVTLISVVLTILVFILKQNKGFQIKYLLILMIIDIWNIDLLLGGCVSGTITSIVISEICLFYSIL